MAPGELDYLTEQCWGCFPPIYCQFNNSWLDEFLALSGRAAKSEWSNNEILATGF